jgi:glycosyltransferase involved in cell wall biosynthesis
LKIDCFTLAYNQGKYLQMAIDSICSQRNLGQYFVYDPGSNDETAAVISRNSTRVKAIFVESDLGPADGLNYGLGLIDSDIFYYLNSDDEVLFGAFDYVCEYFHNNPSCDILHGSVNLIGENGKVYRTLPAMEFTLKGYALGYSVVYQQATFFRSSVLRKSSFNVQNRISWDGEFIVDLALAGAVIHQTQKVLGNFRIYSESITGSGKFRTLARNEHSRIARKILGHDVRLGEKYVGKTIRYKRAITRRFFQMISDLRTDKSGEFQVNSIFM